MPKVITMSDFLRMKREAEAKAKAEAVAKAERKERLSEGLSYLACIILYWIACLLVVVGFFAVALSTL